MEGQMSSKEMPQVAILVIALFSNFHIVCVHLIREPINTQIFSLPGEFKLGGLFSIHRLIDTQEIWGEIESPICTSFNPQEFIGALAMMFAVEEINNSSDFLPHTKLGYEIYDSYQKSEVILQAATKFLTKGTGSAIHVLCNYTSYKTRVIAVVGPSNTEMVTTTGKLFSFFHIPQISFDASSEQFSDKITYPSFLRTVPSDKHQTEGMVQLLKEFQWNWVAVVGSMDEYGPHELYQFNTYASKSGICIAYQAYIPCNSSRFNFNESLREIVFKIRNSGVNVTVVFTSLYETNLFLKSVIESQLKMVWIASTSWSLSKAIWHLPGIENIGTVIGFAVQTKTLPGFNNYFWNMLSIIEQEKKLLQNYSLTSVKKSHHSIYKTKKLQSKCKCCSLLSPDNMTMVLDPVVQNMAHKVYTAVYCVAHALQNVMNCTNINQCNHASHLYPWQILLELKNPKFNFGDLVFDADGNPDIGYDILNWRFDARGPFLTVGNFRNTVALRRTLIKWHNNQVPKSICSKECSQGQIKATKGFHSCCFDCVTCPEGTFVNFTECTACPAGQWSSQGSKTCQNPTFIFLAWTNYLVISLIILMGIIILLIFAVAWLFFQHRHTPVVCASGGNTCFLSLLALACMSVSIGTYIGEPTDLTCRVQQPFLSMCFTGLIGPILVTSMQLLFQSLSNPLWLHWLLYQGRFIIIFFVILLQSLFCTMFIRSSQLLSEYLAELRIKSLEIYIGCRYEPLLPFGLMFASIGFMVLMTFICAFMAEKPPHQYNMGRDITVAMLMLILAWIIFIPTYVSTPIAYRSLTQMGFILSSCLAILSAVFLPKCYIMVYKKEMNSSEYFTTFIPNNQAPKDQ